MLVLEAFRKELARHGPSRIVKPATDPASRDRRRERLVRRDHLNLTLAVEDDVSGLRPRVEVVPHAVVARFPKVVLRRSLTSLGIGSEVICPPAPLGVPSTCASASRLGQSVLDGRTGTRGRPYATTILPCASTVRREHSIRQSSLTSRRPSPRPCLTHHYRLFLCRRSGFLTGPL